MPGAGVYFGFRQQTAGHRCRAASCLCRRSAGVAPASGDAVDRGQQGPLQRRRVGRATAGARGGRHLAGRLAQVAVLAQQRHLEVVQRLEAGADAEPAGE